MKTLVCIYCEGTDTKIAAIEYVGNKLKVIKAASVDVLVSNLGASSSAFEISSDDKNISFDSGGDTGVLKISNESVINSALTGVNLKNALFIPVLTEPSIFYHQTNKKQTNTSKLTLEIYDEIKNSQNIFIDKDAVGYVQLSDKSMLGVFLGADVPCLRLVKNLANYNNRRIYKIASVKSVDLSLAYYVAKRKKFFPDDYSLIFYIGKEYSKLIFLHGRELKHIGPTLDLGINNLHTYDVFFSKILLEMENGGIPTLDNIIVCGEDDSENLILSFYGTFPEANVSRLEFNEVDTTALDEMTRAKLSSFAGPIAAAQEYFDEVKKEHKGINLTPTYIKEDQKPFQFAWHGYAMIPLLFITAFFITQQILVNNRNESELDKEIFLQSELKRQNLELLSQLEVLDVKINAFDRTQAILDSATIGVEIFGGLVETISKFTGSENNLWVRNIARSEQDDIIIEGLSLTPRAITRFAEQFEPSTLKSIIYEPIRESSAYRFNLIFKMSVLTNEMEKQ